MSGTVEPVAWLVEWRWDGEDWVNAHANEVTAIDEARAHGGTVTPLYASPPSPAEVEISDEMVERAAAILPRVWPGGFEDQSVDPLEFRPNERARQVALAVLSAALSAGGRT